MKIIITAILITISIACFGQQEPEFGSVNISTEKYDGKPVVIFSNHGDKFFLNLKTDKFKGNYVLKSLGAHTNMAITETTYDVYTYDGKKVGFKVRHSIGYNYINKKPLHTLTLLNVEKLAGNQVEVNLIAL